MASVSRSSPELVSLPPAPAQAAPADDTITVQPTEATSTKTHTVIVTYDAAPSDAKASANKSVGSIAEAVAGAKIASVQAISKTTYAVRLNTELSSDQANAIQSQVAKKAGVKAAEADIIFQATADPAEGHNYLWSLFQPSSGGSAYSVRADAAWSRTTGKRANGTSVIVGVVDTGITPHPDLTGSASAIVGGNVIAGYDFISDPGNAVDSNGRDTNPTDEGDYHFDTNSKPVRSSWHGTHVSGTIAALKNGTGVVGVAPGVKIEPLRVLGSYGGSTADIATAVRWGAGVTVPGLPKNSKPVNVLNLSLGGVGSCSTVMQSAINAAVAKGVPVVVASGNSTIPLSKISPANCKNVIRVNATGWKGTLASYSDYGTSAAPATIAAPGGSGYSEACLGGVQCGGVLSTLNDGKTTIGSPAYGYEAGTSMAAPHVAAVVALVKALHPTWSPSQITAVLRATATKFPAAAKCNSTKCGTGIVNAGAAVSINLFVRKALPSVSGKFKVGKKLKAKVGSWSPSATKVTYQWLRNGKSIKKATKSTYKLTKKDKRKKLSVRITVRRSGYLTVSAASKAKKVK